MKRKIAGYVLLMLAIVFIIMGIAQGDYRDTRNRASTICLECIGIG